MKYFLSKPEIELSKEFEKKGYIIRNIKNIKDLKLIKQTIFQHPLAFKISFYMILIVFAKHLARMF